MVKLDRNNMQYFCRTCLDCLQTTTEAITASSVNYNILETPNLAKLLILCTTLNINEDTDAAFPQQVCQKCYLSLQEIQRFRDMALQSNEVLRGIVENVDSSEVTTSKNNSETEQLAKAEVENSTDQDFQNEHFETSQPEVSNTYFVVQEKEIEFDEFLDNNREIKIETAMFDIDSYVNPAENAAANGMECSSETVDYASTSKAAAKRKHNADDDDTNTFLCPLLDCTMEFTTIKALQKHNNDVHGSAKNYSLIGKKFVLECDDTEIDDDETLQEVKSTRIIFNSSEISTETVKPPPSAKIADIIEQSGNSFSLTKSTFVPHEEVSQNCIILSQSSPTQHFSNSDVGSVSPEKGEVVLFSTDNPDDETTSSQSTNLSNKNPRAACDLFNNCEIPWTKMSPEISKALREKKQLGKLLNSFCNVVVDELRQRALYIPMSVYRNISQIATNKYPDSFVERDVEGNIMSHTPVSLITTMRNRNNFLNSSKKRTPSFDVPNKKRKSLSVLSKSCVNWQPQSSEHNISDIASKQKILKAMHQNKKLQNSEVENVKKLMSDCFGAQRTFFNDTRCIPTAKDILENWPMIFYKECLFDHFQQLMELDVETFKKNFSASEHKLKSYLKIDESGNSEDIVKAICAHFNEKVSLLFKKFKLGTTIQDVKNDNKALNPWISIIEISPATETNSTSVAYIWLEGKTTTKELNFELVDLILQLLCYYYIFNIEYPKDISQSCEFFMRYFFKFYPSQVRGRKKHINNLKKINTLISKLDFVT